MSSSSSSAAAAATSSQQDEQELKQLEHHPDTELVAKLRKQLSHTLPELSGPDVDAESQAAWAKRYDGSECAICLERWQPKDHLVLTQPCSHILHNKCLDKWAIQCFEKGEEAVSCPVCRKTVDTMRHIAINAIATGTLMVFK